MCLHAARLPARLDSAGDLSPLLDQDRSRWDARLVAEGLALLERSAAGHELTAYHIEAAIAAAHASAPRVDETDWALDRLALRPPDDHRAVARRRAQSRDRDRRSATARSGASRRSARSRDRDRLERYPFYPAAMGELELRRGNRDAAREHFAAALALARNATERRFLEKRLQACASGVTQQGD